MSPFDIFRRKRIYALSDFSADLTEADFQSLLPGFSEHIVDVVHRASIQFYRDIHSHEASPFPKVKDEFFYLIYFVSDKTIRSLFPANADTLANTMHEIINQKMSEVDRSFARDQFWTAYLIREEAYSALYTQSELCKDVIVPESLPYVFSSFLQQHLDCPETIVRHHGVQMAGEAIYLLEGRR